METTFKGGGLVHSLINIPAGQYGTSVSFLLFNIKSMLVSSSASSPSSIIWLLRHKENVQNGSFFSTCNMAFMPQLITDAFPLDPVPAIRITG